MADDRRVKRRRFCALPLQSRNAIWGLKNKKGRRDAPSQDGSVEDLVQRQTSQVQKAAAIQPPFFPLDEDEYIKPCVGHVISYLFHIQEDSQRIYRTGILQDKIGTIRFYDDEEDGYADHCFHLNKDMFKKGYFRVRTDLVVGELCFDWKMQQPYRLLEIDKDSGAVLVESLDAGETTDPVWMSPDDLVGKYMPPSSSIATQPVWDFDPSRRPATVSEDGGEANGNDTIGTASQDGARVVTPQHNNTTIPPPFAPMDDDEYIKPCVGHLISYLFHVHKDGEKIYRTGMLQDKVGTIRFYSAEEDNDDDDGGYVDHRFHLNKEMFKRGFFRVRTDLVIGELCYDWNIQETYRLLEMDHESGAVRVQTTDSTTRAGETDDFWISPDDLVGKHSPLATIVDGKGHELTFIDEPARKKRRDCLDYIGVYIPPYTGDEKTRFYLRGLLRPPNDNDFNAQPILVKGESIRYNPDTGRVEQHDILQYIRGTYLYVATQKEIKEFQAIGQKAEMKFAAKLREAKKAGSSERIMASLEYRPLQPIHDVMKKKNGKIVQAPDRHGFTKVIYDNAPDTEVMVRKGVLRLTGHELEPFDWGELFRNADLPQQRASYRESDDFLYNKWKDANSEKWRDFEKHFETRVMERNTIRAMANSNHDNGTILTVESNNLLNRRSKVLLDRLQSDFQAPKRETMMAPDDYKRRIEEIKRYRPQPNMLLLCGGIAPEVTAWKRLHAAPLGVVIIQDTDLHAVGVAVAAHPDVEFAIIAPSPDSKYDVGDVRAIREIGVIREVEVKIGGIDHVSVTNPCQSFSLAGNKKGFESKEGQLFHDCNLVVRRVGESSCLPSYIYENVPSTKETDESSDQYLPFGGSRYMVVCGSICAPSHRRRKFSTNIPPPSSSSSSLGENGKYQLPSLNGDLPQYLAASVVENDPNRVVHPQLKKFPCLIHSNPTRHELIWQKKSTTTTGKSNHDPPSQTSLTPQEAELAMGYHQRELGVTAYSAERAIRKRIDEHDYERQGPLISLKGCANDLLEPVDDKRRLELLGNSQIVTMVEAFLCNERRLYPAATC